MPISPFLGKMTSGLKMCILVILRLRVAWKTRLLCCIDDEVYQTGSVQTIDNKKECTRVVYLLGQIIAKTQRKHGKC